MLKTIKFNFDPKCSLKGNCKRYLIETKDELEPKGKPIRNIYTPPPRNGHPSPLDHYKTNGFDSQSFPGLTNSIK